MSISVRHGLTCLLCPMLLIGAIVSVAAAEDPKAVRAVSALRKLVLSDDLNGAEQTAHDVMSQWPASRHAKWNAAYVHARRASRALHERRGSDALDEAHKALELHPGRVRYLTLLARAQFMEGEQIAADKSVQNILDRAPRYAPALLLAADVAERAGDFERAIASISDYAALRPDDAERLASRMAELERRKTTEATYLSHSSGNFDVRYSEEADAETVRLAITLLENAYSQVTADLGMQPKTQATVILYADREFQTVTQAHGWVAGLYRGGTLKLPLKNLTAHRDRAARILTHEFVHHVLREQSPKLPSWLHEGIAQYLEQPPNNRHARWQEVTARLRPLKKHVLSAKQLSGVRISATKSGATANLLYAQSHAIVGWLIDMRGLTSFPDFARELARGPNLDDAAKKIYGGTWSELVAAWKEQL